MFLRQDRDTTYPLGSAHSLISWVYPRVCGGTLNPELSRWLMGVYPRVCGGTYPSLFAMSSMVGLSPRVRGNRRHRRGLDWLLGSIPACAGEPYHIGLWQVAPEVYPRVCGGTDKALAERSLHEGLSPRVRGNRCRRGRVTDVEGSIPACAGEPTCAPGTQGEGWVYPRVCGGTTGRVRNQDA